MWQQWIFGKLQLTVELATSNYKIYQPITAVHIFIENNDTLKLYIYYMLHKFYAA